MPTPNPTHEQTQKDRRRINPATAPLDELCAHLATDPAAGLSPGEAERRLDRSTAKPLYATTARRFGECLKRACKEPALWLLLAVSVIALFFDRVGLGLVCLAWAGGNAVLAAYFLYRADRVDAAMQAYDAPLARVMRNRRILRVGANNLVRGDVIILHPGDMVPADCRLLSAENLVVGERELDGTDLDRPMVRLKKDAYATVTDGDFRLSPENMVFAGGVVEEGSARALVVAVGSDTHLGGLIGQVAPAHTGHMPARFKKASGYLSVYNLALVFFIVPVTAVGIFTLGDRYELLDIFLSSLALATVTLTEHLLARGLFAAATVRRDAATDRDGINAVDIKTSDDAEKLTALTDLILVGTAALHDGEYHPETLHVGETVYRCDRPEADDMARAAVELLYLYCHNPAPLPAVGEGSTDRSALVSALSDALCDWSELDTEALMVKVKDIRCEDDGVSGVFPTATGHERVYIRVTADFEEAAACRFCDLGTHRMPLEESGRNALYRAHRHAARTGYRMLYILTRTEGQTAVRAMITYAPHICRKTAGCIKAMEAAGIRVTAFLRDVSDEHTRVLAACGLTDSVPADVPPADGTPRPPAVERVSDGCRAFEGCTDEYVMDYISALRAEGRVVGVLSVEDADMRLLNAADLAMTCAPSLYTAAESGMVRLSPLTGEMAVGRKSPFPEGQDGLPDGDCATDLCRRRADIILRRSATAGGGLGGVRRALLCADHDKEALDATVRFVTVSQLARLLAVLLPLCFGLALTSAPALFLSGLAVDLTVLLASVRLPLPTAPHARRSADAGLTAPRRFVRTALIPAAVSMAVAWLIAGIGRMANVDFGADLGYYSLLCLLGLQIAVFRFSPLPRRNRTAFFATLTLALIYVGAIAVALGAGLSLLWCLIVPLAAPAVYVALRAVLNRVPVTNRPENRHRTDGDK